MTKITYYITNIFFLFSVLLVSSCVKDNSPVIKPVNEYPSVEITFHHLVNGQPLLFDTLVYTTSTGNHYMVNDLFYFICDLKFHVMNGKWIYPASDNNVWYVDARNETVQKWQFNQSINIQDMDSASFTFGLDAINNISYRFPDPPERDMFWPEILGGGYHYMKLNMKWKKDNQPENMPFMFHLGIGQMYSGNTVNTDSIIGFIQNYFKITLPIVKIRNDNSDIITFQLNMNIDKWFDGKYAFDFADYPNGIMQNQEGMFKACENGRNVFMFEVLSY
jgi:hypothetical protein